jgi:hypothetical protein
MTISTPLKDDRRNVFVERQRPEWSGHIGGRRGRLLEIPTDPDPNGANYDRDHQREQYVAPPATQNRF